LVEIEDNIGGCGGKKKGKEKGKGVKNRTRKSNFRKIGVAQ
jgi:hypothetical protein